MRGCGDCESQTGAVPGPGGVQGMPGDGTQCSGLVTRWGLHGPGGLSWVVV